MHPLRIACLDKLNWRNRSYALVLLCVTTAVPLPAQTFTTLHNFNFTDGDDPQGALVQATDGNLYGTTYGGGAEGAGTVFKITSKGKLTMLHGFDSTDGANPVAALIQASDGNFYGTTGSGGANFRGTIFKITTSGRLTVLHNFDGTDGSMPTALVQDTNGTFYGTTVFGGNDNYHFCQGTCGTIFSLSVGLAPFAE